MMPITAMPIKETNTVIDSRPSDISNLNRDQLVVERKFDSYQTLRHFKEKTRKSKKRKLETQEEIKQRYRIDAKYAAMRRSQSTEIEKDQTRTVNASSKRRKRANETFLPRESRKAKERDTYKTKRRQLSEAEKEQQNAKRRRKYASSATEAKELFSHKRESMWRKINQDLPPTNCDENNDLHMLAKDYAQDVEEFQNSVYSALRLCTCSVCGLDVDTKSGPETFPVTDAMFKSLRPDNLKPSQWPRYSDETAETVTVCGLCKKTLRKPKKNIPRLSRANIPVPPASPILSRLNAIEQMLISPVLPMVYFWRYREFGQYQSKGQCIAFYNNVQNVAKVLPRKLSEVVVNVDHAYGSGSIEINVGNVRAALGFLKVHHPDFRTIHICDENFSDLENVVSVPVSKTTANRSSTNFENSFNSASAREILNDAGQTQIVENEVAERSLCSVVAAETKNLQDDIRASVTQVFQSLAKKDTKLYNGRNAREGWHLMYPCILWNGKGGPDGVYVNVSLREWVNYVLRIRSLAFQRHIGFICFSNIVLRRQRITGITANKPISDEVGKAVQELIRMAHSSQIKTIPDNTLRALTNKLSVYLNNLPGSLADMKAFRNNILSMISKHGPPSFFVTVSSADSMWPEVYVELSNGKISIAEAKCLSAKERADLAAQNPVRTTLAWKNRTRALIQMLLFGKSQPLQEIVHVAQKSEWQGRLSEHKHYLFWTRNKLPAMKVDQEGELCNDQQELIERAESSSTAILPDYSTADEIPKEIFNIISRQPICLDNYFGNKSGRREVRELLQVCNTHRCGSYCTRNSTRPCKSRFPFELNERSRIVEIKDERENRTYRVQLRRNHCRINQFHLGISNLWRANIDVSVLCGESLASVIYVTYYTSKVDKCANIREVLNKLKSSDPTTETATLLRRILVNMDTCKITGAPEAASNLLLYPHCETSSKVVRLDTRIYINVTQNETIEDRKVEKEPDSCTLNDLMHSATKYNEDFSLPTPRKETCKPSETRDRIALDYFLRPSELFDKRINCFVDASNVSMVEYIENYNITSKKRVTNTQQSLDIKGRVVEPKADKDADVVLDLKYRVSPPDDKSPKWCLGALALHVPHRSPSEISQIDGEHVSFPEAFAHVFSSHDRLRSSQRFIRFQEVETVIYEVGTKRSRSSLTHCTTVDSDLKRTVISNAADKSGDEESETLVDLDPETYLSEIINGPISLQNRGFIAWSGGFNATVASFDGPWRMSEINLNDTRLSSSYIHVSEIHNDFMSRLIAGENPNSTKQSVEASEALEYCNGNRMQAAKKYLNGVFNDCQTKCQRDAIKLISSFAEMYYFGVSSGKTEKYFSPIISMVGVPGAGKSWVVNKIRNWCELIFSPSQRAFKSVEFNVKESLNQSSDSVTKLLAATVDQTKEGKFGKSAALAFSGAAAGLVKGCTIHSALSFSTSLTKDIKNGDLPLPPLSASVRDKLIGLWSSVKLLIIDEVYTLPVEWLSLIDERLRQIHDQTLPFGGLVVLLVGDPRQIVPVKGKPLYALQQFYKIKDGVATELNSQANFLTQRQQKGYKLYASSELHISLRESIRIKDVAFADLSHRMSKYRTTSKDIRVLNKLVRSPECLHVTPWIDAPWLFPTWRDVNLHLQKVTNLMAINRGIFRAWTPVYCKSNTPVTLARRAIEKFYCSPYHVGADFKHPLPYLDLFLGQIISLKQNWNPTWNLYNNAKAFVVGILYDSKELQNKPFLHLNEAVQYSIQDPDKLRYNLLVKPFIPFTGPSAIESHPGVMVVPWTRSTIKILAHNWSIEGPKVYPANAFSQHQSQGSTFPRSVALVNQDCRSYGMANVALSRTPSPENFALVEPVTRSVLQPSQSTSDLVENEYKRLNLLHKARMNFL